MRSSLLRRTAIADRQMNQKSFGRADGEGGTVRLTLWNHPGNGIYGMYARCNRVVNAMEQLLGGEVYHYHSKMILKDPEVGGAWAWHQDYGYWYDNYVLYPLMSSVSIAVDPATRENGCMQVLKGSHHMGRITHVETGQQAGADLERVIEAEKRLELVHCQAEPGDALFFPLQHPAPLRPEPLQQPALVADLLLQRRPQRSLPRGASPQLHTARKSTRQRHQRDWDDPIRGRRK